MVDTVRSISALQTLLANNTSGGISAQDVRDFLVSTYVGREAQANIENGKTTTDTPDDDFDTGSLDGKWTVVSGTSGTVSMDPDTTSDVDVYDLSTRSELLVQISGGTTFKIRQDYTLPDGNSMIFSFTPSSNVADISLDEYNVVLTLNDNDTNNQAGNYQLVNFNTDGSVPRMVFFDGFTVVDNGSQNDWGHKMYIRVNREALIYTWFYSYDGNTWVPLRRQSESSAFNNVWIAITSTGGTTTRPIGITPIHWIRQGNVSIDPW